MNTISDQEYLRNHQYRTSDNLESRIRIHNLYSTNSYGWYRWQYEALNIQPGECLLDLGCGPGALWVSQARRLPAKAEIHLCDLSTGMMQQARKALVNDGHFHFAVCDAQAIPFPSSGFNLVTANHMLYHVPDIVKAALEIRRVLKPGGRFAAATNGLDHMRELHELIHKIAPGFKLDRTSASRFGLENGPDLLKAVFPRIEVVRYPDDLLITDIEDLVRYIGSMASQWHLDKDIEPRLREEIGREIDEKGGFFIRKSSGILLAQLE